MLLLVLLQASILPTPDIELRVQARAKSVIIEQRGETRLRVHVDPDAGSHVQTTINPKPEGRTQLRNISVDIVAAANISDAAQKSSSPETSPQD